MIEKQSVNGKDVWIKVDPFPMHRQNPAVIPTEYFVASYFFEEPTPTSDGGKVIDDDGEPKLFESPVAALSFARKELESK